MMKRNLTMILLFAGLCVACETKTDSNSGSADQATEQPAPKPAPVIPANQAALAIEAQSDLPLCEASKKDQVYYVRAEAALYACSLEGTVYKNIKLTVTGQKGAQGDKGETGDQGAKGEKGDVGDTGAQGAPGAKGPTGDAGGGALTAQCLNDMQSVEVDPFKELVIVEDAALTGPLVAENGAWNFGSLLRQMMPAEQAGDPAAVAAFTRALFSHWDRNVTVAGSTVAATPRNGLLQEFLCDASTNNGPGCTVANAEVNPNQLPFKLIAIVNRLDLQEGRFVYGLNNGSENKFTVIFEYDYTKVSGMTLSQWASEWHSLGNFTCTSGNCGAYQTALKQVTDRFTSRNVGPGPNGNAIGQIRTNEAFFTDPPWEFREFNLTGAGASAVLTQVDVKKNPPSSMNNSQELAQLIANNAQAILDNTFVMPNGFKGSSTRTDGVRGGAGGPGFKWEFDQTSVSISEELRHAFAINTCIGCHISETARIDGFYHISPMVNNNGIGRLSGFMLDNQIPTRRFNLMKLVTPSCNFSSASSLGLRIH